ncbi:low molecular weight phosphatase family protein [Ilumatobacter sp.]|uniref:arsenate-mycothiol transferase ArsC n=1 Tax=Ilumatobacter sp. TaxID=1967498 RepID=UPI003C5C5F63
MEERLVRNSAERLQRQFAGTFNTETIERYIHDSQTQLTSQATVSRWLPVLIERVTRDRLRAVMRLDGIADTKPAVLFLCVHNAGRSQIAAGWMRHLAGDLIDVFSGGSMPAADSNQGVVDTMAAVGIDISTEYPKPWTDDVVRAADVIVSMGCGEACPIVPGTQYLDWDIPSPTGGPADALAEVRDDIRTRVEALIASLGVLR